KSAVSIHRDVAKSRPFKGRDLDPQSFLEPRESARGAGSTLTILLDNRGLRKALKESPELLAPFALTRLARIQHGLRRVLYQKEAIAFPSQERRIKVSVLG